MCPRNTITIPGLPAETTAGLIRNLCVAGAGAPRSQATKRPQGTKPQTKKADAEVEGES